MERDAPNPELARLDPLVGEWELEMDIPGQPGAKAHGRAIYEWLKNGHLMVQRSWADDPFPDGVSLVAWDGELGRCVVHYFDSRGVIRLYEASLHDGVLRLSREGEGEDFSQRFTGTLSEDGRTIDAAWERTGDDGTWQHDFDLTYTKVN